MAWERPIGPVILSGLAEGPAVGGAIGRAPREVCLVLLLLAAAGACFAGDTLPALEDAAQRIRAATVTVRVWNPLPDDQVPLDAGGRLPAGEAQGGTRPRVTICTGVAVDRRRVVTPIYAASDSRIWVTIAGGDQTAAQLRVLDEYSGLALIEADKGILTPVPLAESVPQAGAWVLSAAAWGAESPAISLGIVGAAQRTLPGAAYPTLVQCDLRTVETSSGAGVVDRVGKLIGVVVAADQAQGVRGWTYAVPVRHVHRLVRAAGEGHAADSVIILRRRRPTVGMVLDGNPDGILVSHIYQNSPAQKAGIQVGDRILAADGVKIRSVYQAVRPMLHKQPGDKMEFLVQRQGRAHKVEVVLGGGVELASAPFANLGQYVRPKLDIEQLDDGRYASRSGQTTLREVLAPEPLEADPAHRARTATAAEKIQLLEKALDGYRQAIGGLQERLRQEQHRRENTERQIESLQAQMEQLKAELTSQQPDGASR